MQFTVASADSQSPGRALEIGNAGGATSFTDRPAKTGTYRYQVRAVDPVHAKSPLSVAVYVVVLS